MILKEIMALYYLELFRLLSIGLIKFSPATGRVRWLKGANYSENHTRAIESFCGKSAQLLNVKEGGTYY
jgi:hypothetical protein